MYVVTSFLDIQRISGASSAQFVSARSALPSPSDSFLNSSLFVYFHIFSWPDVLLHAGELRNLLAVFVSGGTGTDDSPRTGNHLGAGVYRQCSGRFASV